MAKKKRKPYGTRPKRKDYPSDNSFRIAMAVWGVRHKEHRETLANPKSYHGAWRARFANYADYWYPDGFGGEPHPGNL